MRDDFLKDLQKLQEEVGATLEALQYGFALFSKKLSHTPNNISILNYLENINLYQIKKTANLLLLKQSPIARDFFMISGILSLANEIEELNKSLKYADETLNELIHFQHKQEVEQMTLLIDAILIKLQNLFYSKEVEILTTILELEKQINQYCFQNKAKAILELKKQDACIDDWINFLILSKYLEKVSSHLVRMGDFIVYSIKGRLEE